MAPYIKRERIPVSREQLVEYFDKNVQDLDPLEGIWFSDDYVYEVAIFRDSTNAERDFVAVVLQTSAATWQLGQVKMEVTRTSAPGVYRVSYYLRNHSKHTAIANLDGNVLRVPLKAGSGETAFFTKSYPGILGGTDIVNEQREIGRGLPSVELVFWFSEDGFWQRITTLLRN